MQYRTDLAAEAVAGLAKTDLEGVEQREFSRKGLQISNVAIRTPEAAERLGKAIGRYVTLYGSRMFEDTGDMDEKVNAVAFEISQMLPKKGCVLVVGLGNRDITPDALGPLVARSILATRHIGAEAASVAGLDQLRPVAVFAPGVLGQTGIETAELISAVCRSIHPAAVVVIDALAARDTGRMTTTIQISDTGIQPGAGVQNRRVQINRETLQAPVISIGVPTVVDAVTLAGEVVGHPVGPSGDETDQSLMMVTSKDIDILIKRAANLLALAINRALQPILSKEDIAYLIS